MHLTSRLTQLEGGTLQGLDRLEELDLSSNFLTQVPDQAIKDLTRLRTLILKDNLIQVREDSLNAFEIHEISYYILTETMAIIFHEHVI